MNYVVDNGNRVELELDRSSRSGGRGAVYPVISAAYAKFVAKIYHDSSQFERERVEAMISTPPDRMWMTISGQEEPIFAWPTHIIEDSTGTGVGFLMPRIDTNRAVILSEYNGEPDRLPLADRSITLRVTVARNLAAALSSMHARRHYFVDLKPENIFVFKGSGNVCLLDCDGYSIAGGKYPASQYTPEYRAPEIIINRTTPESMSLNDYQDRFALAVLIFQIMNFSIHPFRGAPLVFSEGFTEEMIKRRLYAYGRVSHEDNPPKPGSIHEYWDDATRDLLEQAFTVRKPSERPSADNWREHLDRLLRDRQFVPCKKYPDDVQHIHFEGKPCFTCDKFLGEHELVTPTLKVPEVESSADKFRGKRVAGYLMIIAGACGVAISGVNIVFILLAAAGSTLAFGRKSA